MFSAMLFFFIIVTPFFFSFFFFNDTATTEIYTLSLHDALPISRSDRRRGGDSTHIGFGRMGGCSDRDLACLNPGRDRKSTRLNSSYQIISYAVFCLKKKKKYNNSWYKSLMYADLCRVYARVAIV